MMKMPNNTNHANTRLVENLAGVHLKKEIMKKDRKGNMLYPVSYALPAAPNAVDLFPADESEKTQV